MKKNIYFILIIIFVAINLNLYGAESEKDQGLIDIIQKSKTKFYFYQEGKRLYSKKLVLRAMSDIPEVANLYELIHKKYVGMNVIMGLGIGFAGASSVVFLEFLILTMLDSSLYYPYNQNENYPLGILTNYLFWGTVGSGVSLIASIVMWIVGARYRVYFRIKRAEAVRLYNKKKKKISEEDTEGEVSVWFKPDIKINKEMAPNIRIAFSVNF